MKIYEFVYKGDARIRVDVALATHLTHLTRSQIRSLSHVIMVNGKPCKSSYKLKEYDAVYFEYEERCPPSARAENIKIKVIYEDPDVIVVNKRVGIITHPSFSAVSGTLVNALNHYRLNVSQFKDEFAYLMERGCIEDDVVFSRYVTINRIPASETDVLRLGIVHRLDRDTSGLIITARNFKTQMFLKDEFRKRRVKKFYIAILVGLPFQKEGLIKTSIFRSKKDGRRFATSFNLEKGKIAVSRYKVVKTFGMFSLVKFRIYTGRTHQIRLHAKHMGCPILADEMYGHKMDAMHLFLHCYRLEVNIAKGLHKVFKLGLPKRFKTMLAHLSDVRSVEE